MESVNTKGHETHPMVHILSSVVSGGTRSLVSLDEFGPYTSGN